MSAVKKCCSDVQQCHERGSETRSVLAYILLLHKATYIPFSNIIPKVQNFNSMVQYYSIVTCTYW